MTTPKITTRGPHLALCRFYLILGQENPGHSSNTSKQVLDILVSCHLWQIADPVRKQKQISLYCMTKL